LGGGVKSLVLILHFATKKDYLNKIIFSSVVQMGDCKQRWQLEERAHEPQEFLEFVNKSGWGSYTKI